VGLLQATEVLTIDEGRIEGGCPFLQNRHTYVYHHDIDETLIHQMELRESFITASFSHAQHQAFKPTGLLSKRTEPVSRIKQKNRNKG
jgi:hypothetical protein